MKQADLNRLAEPYPGDGTTPPPGLAAALGVAVPNWERLESEMLADLCPAPPYGIGWWSPDPGTSKRILISDQLYCCTHSVPENLIEAGLHWLEFSDYAEREGAHYSGGVQSHQRCPNVL